ncbi:PREDICTED: uncharacterized protein LOC106341509 [Brassica oleracea var. oleracea]|uniref:uncharacterized protein LOC106341509 n=1 Tax=Brassica oleracea var. oleracea TaxID=109376 RepID=UPI0006A6F48D|nr:PREDICTED: uncharacterized protein LOC106341509 [Brassica oleracea var. oleracea]
MITGSFATLKATKTGLYRFVCLLLMIASCLVLSTEVSDSGIFVLMPARFEPDMLAFSGCYYGGGDKERRELAAIRRRWKTLHVMPTCVCVRGGMMIGLLKQGSYAKEKFCSLCI